MKINNITKLSSTKKLIRRGDGGGVLKFKLVQLFFLYNIQIDTAKKKIKP